MQNTKRMFDTKTLIVLAMITAIAFILAWLVRFPVLPGGPPLRYDPKDVVIVIAGFMFGPLAAFIVTVVVSVLQFLTVSATGWVGLVMNIVSGTAFAVTASFIYSKKRTLSGAVMGLIAGTILMTIVMMLWNLILTPIFMGWPREAVVALLIPFFMPFNLFCGIVNSTLIMLIYKPLGSALRAARLAPATPTGTGTKRKIFSPGVIAVSLFVFITAVLWSMARQEVGFFSPAPEPVYAVVNGEEVTGVTLRAVGASDAVSHVSLQPVLDALGIERDDLDLGTWVYERDEVEYVPLAFFREVVGMNNAFYLHGRVYINNDEVME